MRRELSGSEDEDLNNLSQGRCSEIFADHLTHLYISKRLPGTEVAVLAYWATKAGAVGFCSKLAMKPGGQSGHYSRHLDTVLQKDNRDSRYYDLQLPLFRPCDAMRVEEVTEVYRLHDA